MFFTSDSDVPVSIIRCVMEMNCVRAFDSRDREFSVGCLWIVIVAVFFLEI